MTDFDRATQPVARSRGPYWGAPTVILLTFLLVGCYTILKHPITADEGPDRSAYHQEYYRQQCIDCHADYAEYPYGFFYGDYPDYYFQYPRFGYYYAYPWWWDHYWYDGNGNQAGAVDENGNPVEPSQKASRRGSLAPPYVQGTTALPTGGGYRAPTYIPSKGGTGSGTGSTEPTKVGEKIRVKKADKTSDSEDDSQNTNSEKKGKASRRGGIDP